MKMKKLVSAIAALALSVSAFAGLTVFAAEETATLEAMRSWNGSKGTFTVSDTEIMGQSGPSSKSSNYPGIGVVKFSFENADGLLISKATLTYNAKHTQNKTASCTYDMYTVGNPSYDFSNVPLLSTADGANDGIYTQTANGTVWTYSEILGTLTSVHQGTVTNAEITENVDVTDYVAAQTAVDGKYYAAFAFSNSTRGIYAINPTLTITYADATAIETDITINFVYGDENTAIDSASLPAGTVTSDKQYSGQVYTAEYPATFDAVEGDATYRYTYAGAEGDDTITVSTVAEENVVTLKYTREQLQYKDVLVKAVDAAGTELSTFVSSTVLVGGTVNYGYPKYLADANGKVTYVCDSNKYSGSLVVSEDDGANTVEIAYTAYDGDAWYVEGEKFYTVGWVDNANLSNGRAGRGNTKALTVLTVPEDGTYDLTYVALSSNVGDNKGGTMSVYKNSAEEANLISSINVDHISFNYAQTTGTTTVTGLELKAGDTIITQGTMSTTSLDYILITKVVDAPVIPTEFEGKVEFVSSYEESDTVEGNATALKATFNALGYSFNTLTFTVTVGENSKTATETLETAVTGESDVVYGLIIDGAIVAAEDVTAVATLVE